jgi:hypothetical protein
MNDEEARYLIDQFNRYVSWNTTRTQLSLSGWIIVLAFSAFGVSVFGLFASNLPLVEPYRTYLFCFAATGVLLSLFAVSAIMIIREFRSIPKTEENYRDALLHWKNIAPNTSLPNKALPDGITFKLVIEKPEEVEKLSEESEPTPKGSPQT